MDVRLVLTIRKELEARTTEELRGLYEARDLGSWSPEAFHAMREILIARGALDPDSPLPLPAEPDAPAFAYSRLAGVALIFGMLAAALGCIAATIASVGALSRGDWLNGLLIGPIAFFLQLAMLVAFLRVRDIRPRA